MSLENLNTNIQKKLVPEVVLPSRIALAMPSEVLDQIKYLCKNIPKVEWSGILFYTIEGSIRNIETFKIILKGILPMDMGTSSFTSYDLDDRFINYLEEDFEERATWKVGHIHSHHCMRVFFSGTDSAELNENAAAHNFYLSLIVNNYMEFVARVAYLAKASQSIPQVPYKALDENGEEYIVEHVDFKVDNSKVYIHECEISSPVSNIAVAEDFHNAVEHIKKPKPVPPPVPVKLDSKPTPKLFDPVVDLYSKKEPFDFFDEIEEEEMEIEMAVEDFLSQVIIKSFNLSSAENYEDLFACSPCELIDALSELNMSAYQMTMAFINTYPTVFHLHFPNSTSADFVNITYRVIAYLQEYAIGEPFIRATISQLNKLLNQYITDEHFGTTK